MNREDFRKMINRIWPKARRDLEKGVNEAKRLIEKGEKHIADATDRGMRGIKTIELQLRKEKLHYELGRLVSILSPAKWQRSVRIKNLRDSIRKLNKEIASLKSKK